MPQVTIVLRYLNLKLRNNGFVKTDPRFDSAYVPGENKMHVKKAFECWVGIFLCFFLFPLTCSLKIFSFCLDGGMACSSYFIVP